MNYCFRISQSHLNLLEICPPQFQKIYLEKLNSPTTPVQEEKTQWGSLFHLLMQQINLGLSLDSLVIENEELKKSVQALISETSEIWKSKKIISRQAENYLSLSYENYLLTVIYDLLVCYENKAIIYDWKTYLQPQNSEKLAKNWQTRLYLYVLTETFNYQPEDISMTYWFVRLPHKPEKLTFNYTRKKHEETKKDLHKILQKLNSYLEDYYYNKISLPHHDNCENNCPYVDYFLQLNNSKTSPLNYDNLISIDKIEEIKIDLRI